MALHLLTMSEANYQGRIRNGFVRKTLKECCGPRGEEQKNEGGQRLFFTTYLRM
jgi:hypothetical protein